MNHWLFKDRTTCFLRKPFKARGWISIPVLLLTSLVAEGAPPKTAAVAADAAAIKGALVIVGGGPLPEAIRDRFLELAGGPKARLVVIPTASDLADQPEMLKSFHVWKQQNVAAVDLLHTRNPDLANDPEFVRPLVRATGVWLSGGDQSRLIAAYRGTAVEKALQELLIRGGVIGGTSAGAAVMSPVMILGGNPQARVGPGFGFLPHVVIDQHFQNRQRLDRLVGVLAKNPHLFGLGIDEETALVVKGRTGTVIGNANVRVCQLPVSSEPPDVQVLKAGDQVDLIDLNRTVQARRSSFGPEQTSTSTAEPPRPTGK